MQNTIFYAVVDGIKVCEFKRGRFSAPRALFNGFQRYAKGRGYFQPVLGGNYIGGVAWRNSSGQTMKLVEGD